MIPKDSSLEKIPDFDKNVKFIILNFDLEKISNLDKIYISKKNQTLAKNYSVFDKIYKYKSW